jgi:hypothetical protein
LHSPAFITVAGTTAFAISAALLIYVSLTVAWKVASDGRAAFWIGLASAALQIGAICLLLSFIRSLTPAWFLAVQAVLAVAIWRTKAPRRADAAWRPSLASFRKPVRFLLLLVILSILACYVLLQIRTPLSHFDDRMYRGSRAAYWLEHRSLLPWETHNDRQVAFPFGSELVFFWPILMSRSELVGRSVFVLVAPLCAAGAYTLMREARVARTAALAGVLLLIVTPSVARTFAGLSPESWLALFVMGAAFFAIRAARRRGGRAARQFLLVGLFSALAMNVKATAIALVLLALALPVLLAARGCRWAGVKRIVAGGAVGAALSGIGFLLCTNVLRYGHPLGPPMMVTVHRANFSARQVRTHIARFLVTMIDLPVVPSSTVRTGLTQTGRAFLRIAHADRPLILERTRDPWPGTYTFDAGGGSLRFSTGGMLWVIALVSSLTAGAHDAFRRRTRRPARDVGPRGLGRLRSGTILALLSITLLTFTLLTVRWMGQIDRFWVASYAVGVPLIALEFSRSVRRRPWLRYVVAGGLVITAWLPVQELSRALAASGAGDPGDGVRLLDEPFFAALRHIPPGSRILLVAGQATRDYPLFAPRSGYANTVVSWGVEPFSEQRMIALLERHHITHVVLESDLRVAQHWRPSLATAGMAAWLRSRPDWLELPRAQTSVPLFVRRSRDHPADMGGQAPATTRMIAPAAAAAPS